MKNNQLELVYKTGEEKNNCSSSSSEGRKYNLKE